MKADFTRNLLNWNKKQNKRKMPWKGEKDPYRIWLSEIILQQTRVEQGLDYYLKFIQAFPTIHELAKSPSRKLYKLWEGLGYNKRCQNLHETAKYISTNLEGRFPTTYPDILNLKGIGQYTAAAIASFAYNLPYAVVDANVERVLSRYFGISVSAGSSAAKKMFNQVAGALLDKKNPGIYNQAIMDFGAVICKPHSPLCSSCMQRKECIAYKNGWVEKLPLKKPKPEKKTPGFIFFCSTRVRMKSISGRETRKTYGKIYMNFQRLNLQRNYLQVNYSKIKPR
jgi:A/G-specific adenine glycosylase